MNENTVSIETGYQVFMAVVQAKHGALPEGVQRWLKVAYYQGACGALLASRVIGEMPSEQQQAALNALVRELAEETL